MAFPRPRIKIRFSEGTPNIEAREDIKITDMGPIVRAIEGEAGAATLCNGAGAGPGRTASRSTISARTGREFTSGRCLIPADGFYEFTDPADKKKKRKDKWLFTRTGEPWFCIAGIWRTDKDVGEAFTMLTMPPGPDIAPYHDRQIAILDRADWACLARSLGFSEGDLEAAPAPAASPSSRWAKSVGRAPLHRRT